MKKYLDMRNNEEYEKLEEAGKIIRGGGIVLFPTETVYGIGANGLDKNAVEKIFIAKGRKQDNPLILHIANMRMLEEIAKNVTELEYKLMNTFWPGPFTIVLNKKEIVPEIVTAGLNTVGVRMPSNVITRKLIEYSKTPIAAPSANISGKPSGTNIEDIFDELSNKVDYIIDGGECKIGVESTVIRVVDGIPHILRPGGITAEQIEEVSGEVIIDRHILNKTEIEEKVMSPGMKYKHYAPQKKCILVYSSNNEKLVKKINELIKENNCNLVISTRENIKEYNVKNVIDMGARENLDEICRNIFKILRRIDKYDSNIAIIEGVKKEKLGLAIMNRLIRACGYNYIEV